MTGVKTVKICLQSVTCLLLELPVLYSLHLSTVTVGSLTFFYNNAKFYCSLRHKCNLQYVRTDGWSLYNSLYFTYSQLQCLDSDTDRQMHWYLKLQITGQINDMGQTAWGLECWISQFTLSFCRVLLAILSIRLN